MGNTSDFVIKNECLEKYLGNVEVVVIPENVTRIDRWAFKDNSAIKKIVFGENVSYISTWGFEGCNHLSEYEISEYNSRYRSVDGIIFTKDMKKLCVFPSGRGGEYTVPEGIETIGAYAFYKNCNLTAVHLPESITAIESGAFSNCDGIKSVHIPPNVAELDCESTFGNNIESINVDPKNKKYASLDGMVFSGKFKTLQYCPPKKKGDVFLPETVSGINAYAFKNCSQITKIAISEKVSKIGALAFYNCSGLTEITIPENVTAINNDAFANCTSLKKISLPPKIKTVTESMFENCKNLIEVNLPSELLAVEGRAFSGCESLKEIVLPPHVTKLGADAFSANTAVFCPAEIFKKLPTPTKETTCVKYLEESEHFSEKLADVIVAYIKKNKQIFFETLIKDGNVSAFRNCLALFKMTKAMMDECLELSARYNKPGINFVLLDINNQKSAPPTKKEKEKDVGVIAAEDSEKFILSSKEAKKLFKFTETPDGAIINGYKGTEAKVTIPEQIGEYPVIGIKKGAFDRNSIIEEVVLPDSITKIDSAFWKCPNLRKINLPKNLVELGRTAFRDCTKLQRTDIPASLKKIGDEAFSFCPSFADDDGFVIVGDILFGYYGTAEKVVVPEGVKTIALFAFFEQERIQEVVFPKSLKKIAYIAFRGCPALKKITIYKGLSSIHEDAFSGCNTKLLTIYAPAGSPVETYAKKNNISFVAE